MRVMTRAVGRQSLRPSARRSYLLDRTQDMIMQVPGTYVPIQARTRIRERQFHKSLDGTLGLAEDD